MFISQAINGTVVLLLYTHQAVPSTQIQGLDMVGLFRSRLRPTARKILITIIGVAAFATLFNITLAVKLSLSEAVILIIHI